MNEPGFESLHPNARWTLRVGAVLGTTVPAAIGAGALLVLLGAEWPLGWAARAGGVAAAMLTGAVIGWAFAGASFRRIRYRLDTTGLEIHRGVFWRTRTRIPRNRVQHTDVNRGPLDRALGLATLKVYTAGTRLASVELDGLAADRALELRDALLVGHDDAL
jgi:uncharacterized protein